MTTQKPTPSKRDPDSGKLSKRSVDYSPGMKSAHCAICAHYRSPGRCEIVAGSIDPSMWCKRFQKR